MLPLRLTNWFIKDSVWGCYCKKKSPIVAGCPILQQKGRRNRKPVNCVNSVEKPSGGSVRIASLTDFGLFAMDGFVSLSYDCREVPVNKLRDTV